MRRCHRDAPRAFVRGTRASAGLELGFGAVALLAVAALCFDLYARVDADITSARLAVTMADYVSRGPDTEQGTLDGAALKALGRFLHESELNAAADLVFVVSAIRQPAGTPMPAVEVMWTDNGLRFGDATVTAELVKDCSRFLGTKAGETGAATATLPDGFALAAGEVVVVAEACARPAGPGSKIVKSDIYRHHVLPARAPGQALPAPVYSGGSGAGDAGGSV